MSDLLQLLHVKEEPTKDEPTSVKSAPTDVVWPERPDADTAVDASKREDLGRPFAPPDPDHFREVMLNRMASAFDVFGGPRQYLDYRFPTPEAKVDFAAALLKVFPRVTGVSYHEGRSPPDTLDGVIVHPTSLAWEDFCSTKPPPYRCVAMELGDEYVTHGFVTSTDVLKLSGKTCDPSHCDFFTLSYVKGAARAATLLVLLDQILLSTGDKIWDHFPGLASSVQKIHAAKVNVSDDPLAIAFSNATLSQRGSIRRAHDTVTWLGTLHLLRQHNPNLDGTTIVNKWNSQCTRAAQLVGSKKSSLLNLLACRVDEILLLLSFVSRVGTDGKCFAEDCFANKRIMPGFAPRSYSPTWNGRLRVTPESFHTMLQALIIRFERKPKALRRLYDKAQIEDVSAQSALLLSSIAELKADVPLDVEHIATADAVVTSFENGDSTLELQLQSYLSEKHPNFTYSQLDQLQAIAALKRDVVHTFPLHIVSYYELNTCSSFKLMSKYISLYVKPFFCWLCKQNVS